MTPGLLDILIFLTVYRATRFVIEDTWPPVGVPREYLLKFLSGHWGGFGRTLHYLFTCPWCMSVWVGGGIIYALTFFTSVPLPILVWASASGITGLLANLEEKLSS